MTIKTSVDIRQDALNQLLGYKVVKNYSCSMKGEYRLTMNLNKLDGDILNFKKFVEKFDETMDFLGIRDYQLQRVDLRLDSYEPGFYKQFYKIHRYLISGLAVAYAVKNGYATTGLFSEDKRSVAVRANYFQIEYYNRSVKNFVTDSNDSAKARLEFRTTAKQWNTYRKKLPRQDEIMFIEPEFRRHWKEIFDKAVNALSVASDCYNEILLQRWQGALQQESPRYRNHNSFLRQNADLVFSRRQMIALLKSMEIKNPLKAADNFISRYDIELFLKKDILAIMREIRNSINIYFGK